MRSGPALTSAGSLGSSALLRFDAVGSGFDSGGRFGDQFVQVGHWSRCRAEFSFGFGNGGGELIGLGFVGGDFLLLSLGGGEFGFEFLQLGLLGGIFLRGFECGARISDGFVGRGQLGGLCGGGASSFSWAAI
jgi:hypothetical protein